MSSRPRETSLERQERRERREKAATDRKERERQRDKDAEREREKERDRKHRSSHAHRSVSTKEKSASKTSLSSNGSRKRSSMPGVVEESGTASLLDARPKSQYPSFSKEFSKESTAPKPGIDLFTPPATDINASKEKLANLNRIINNGPPSPPLTERTSERSKASPARNVTVDTIVEEEKKEDSSDAKAARRVRSRESRTNKKSRRSSEDKSASLERSKSRPETPQTPIRDNQVRAASLSAASQPTRTVSPPHNDSTFDRDTVLSSEATSIAPEQPNIQRPGSKIPQAVNVEHFTQQPRNTPWEPHFATQTPIEILPTPNSAVNTPSSMGPPPPPPAPDMPISVPRVDYLLQHGGLHHTVTKNLLRAGKPMVVEQSPMTANQNPIVVANLFEPFNQLLQDYEKVLSKNGSLAVATGYKSVARRLLDRLEAVFARDLSHEICTCSICEFENQEDDDIRGASWGEILELVSGRKDLPSWPPFTFKSDTTGLGVNMNTLEAPMQKLDIDVPEEYREHYVRQSQKTKLSVDRWLNRNQPEETASAPEEVDDETLTFAILTYIPVHQRAIYKDLLGIVDLPPEPPRRAPSPERDQHRPIKAAPTPIPRKARPEYIIAAGQAIQRLYRLPQLPRDPETALYLLNNTDLHHPLATLAAVSNDEWDILISGRFDGFLRSGAEDDYPPPTLPTGRYTPQNFARMPSRGATPAYGPTRSRQNSNTYVYPRPATAPGHRSNSGSGPTNAPIALDEDTEIATLSEIERDIYTGMEVLEDAFEQLHLRAEAVRHAIRERNAGLAAAQQRRKQSEIEIRAGTPASYNGDGVQMFNSWDNETDDGFGDDISEIAPDDSASNISSNRRRKHKRRNERRTPVVGAIDEEDESEGYGTRESSPEKR